MVPWLFDLARWRRSGKAASKKVVTPKRIALIGDYSPDVVAHVAIPKAIEIASTSTGHPTTGAWVATTALQHSADALREFDAVWCVPASPYASMDGALSGIRHARETRMPFLGTCGGYQHAVLEFARNVLGYSKADNVEVNPDAEMPLVAPLACALVEQHGDIEFVAGSNMAKLHGATRVREKYHCSYGIAPQYVGLFDESVLDFTGFDANGEPRAFEIKTHPFFIGTAYQPERSALLGVAHPLVQAFVSAIAGKLTYAA
jgi:CTP synthase